eukprot:355657-Chlamydomonas_euryale.AAC.11
MGACTLYPGLLTASGGGEWAAGWMGWIGCMTACVAACLGSAHVASAVLRAHPRRLLPALSDRSNTRRPPAVLPQNAPASLAPTQLARPLQVRWQVQDALPIVNAQLSWCVCANNWVWREPRGGAHTSGDAANSNADGAAADGHTGDGHTGDGRTGDGHTGDGHTGDGHTGDGHTRYGLGISGFSRRCVPRALRHNHERAHPVDHRAPGTGHAVRAAARRARQRAAAAGRRGAAAARRGAHREGGIASAGRLPAVQRGTVGPRGGAGLLPRAGARATCTPPGGCARPGALPPCAYCGPGGAAVRQVQAALGGKAARAFGHLAAFERLTAFQQLAGTARTSADLPGACGDATAMCLPPTRSVSCEACSRCRRTAAHDVLCC